MLGPPLGMSSSFLKPRENSPLNVVWREGTLAAESCRQIIDYCDRLAPRPADMTGPQLALARQSTVTWLPLRDESAAVYDFVSQEVQKINEQHFGFDLVGFGEPLQYARYRSGNDHYDWHIDSGPGASSLRKLSVIIQLTGETEYEGGDVQFQAAGAPVNLPRARGTLAIFSPFLLHRVTPVTRGERQSLVAWITGPPFR